MTEEAKSEEGYVSSEAFEAETGQESTGQDDPVSVEKLTSHFKNKDIHWGWRYGIPVFLIGTLVLLLVADISSGVTAKTMLIVNGELDSINEILTVSIVSSVRELWNVGSYPLAIFICLTSVSWPYVKLILSLVAWMQPIRNLEKRERFIEIVDSLDKWSFVDVFVLTIIMVAFRSSVFVAEGVSIEVFIVPKWGFFAFVGANMMSLVGTQAILYQHRKIQYHNEDGDEKATDQRTEEESADPLTNVESKVCVASQTFIKIPLMTKVLVLSFLFAACIVLHLIGCALNIFEIINTRKNESFVQPYSVISIGLEIPDAATHPDSFGIRWIQFMFMLFAVVLPVWNILLFAVLYFVPMTQGVKERVFFLAEITYSWAAVEVLTVSVIFSILQVPKFGNGLNSSGCSECFEVDSGILTPFVVLAASTVLNVAVNVLLFLRAHEAVFPSERGDENAGSSSSSSCCRCLRRS